MTIRERLADWISGGALTRERRNAQRQALLANKWFWSAVSQSERMARIAKEALE